MSITIGLIWINSIQIHMSLNEIEKEENLHESIQLERGIDHVVWQTSPLLAELDTSSKPKHVRVLLCLPMWP